MNGRRTVGVAILGAALAALGGNGCVTMPLRGSSGPPPAAVLHPQVSVAQGDVRLQPRHARESRPLVGPVLLEPGDWIETGADGKVEILLPEAAIRVFAQTRIQVFFAFEDRTVVSTELSLEDGEVLVRRAGAGPFAVKTQGTQVDIPPPGLVLVATRDQVHHAACYEGSPEARNIRVRGQTVIRLSPGQCLTLDDRATLAYLEDKNLPPGWKAWREEGTRTAEVLPPKAPPGPAPPE